MKKLIFLIGIALCGCSARTPLCDSVKCEKHIKRYAENYTSKNTISFGAGSDNDNYSYPYKLEERIYDADDFRAGARHVCGAILVRTGKDVCKEVGYTALY